MCKNAIHFPTKNLQHSINAIEANLSTYGGTISRVYINWKIFLVENKFKANRSWKQHEIVFELASVLL